MRTHALCICAGILFVFSARCNGEEFNLFGEAGQAYAIDINVGSPPQKLSVLVDTGSTTLAIASYPHQDNDVYFHAKNTTTIFDYGKEVQAKYSQGMWVGRLVSDLVQFPSLPNVLEVRSDIALITKSHKFFMNGSGWQGLLGLAYLPVGAWGENVIVESWLDSLDRSINKPTSFNLTLCGPQGFYNSTHAGHFKMIVDQPTQPDQLFRTTILRKRWYEVGVISIRVIQNNSMNNISYNTSTEHQVTSDKKDEIVNQENCQKLNAEKSIVDSGTTNIRLPDVLFRQVVDELRNAAQASNVLILDEFWYHGESTGKLDPGMRGPYKVIRVLPNGRYELKLLSGGYGKTTQAAAQYMVPWRGEWCPESCAAFFEHDEEEDSGAGAPVAAIDPAAAPSTSSIGSTSASQVPVEDDELSGEAV